MYVCMYASRPLLLAFSLSLPSQSTARHLLTLSAGLFDLGILCHFLLRLLLLVLLLLLLLLNRYFLLPRASAFVARLFVCIRLLPTVPTLQKVCAFPLTR